MDTTKIDFFRKEKRFFIPAAQTTELLGLIEKSGLVPAYYSDNAVTQTVYLLDDDQTWSLGVSLKARRYLKNHSERILLGAIMGEPYNFEIKREADGAEAKKKEKLQGARLSEIIGSAGNSFPGIRPYLAAEYKRRHFVFPGQSWCRVTMDTETKLWFFPRGEPEAACIKDFQGPESITRLEIKVDAEREAEDLIASFLDKISHFGAQPVISKKQEGLNAVKVWLDRKHASPMMKELKDCEIEAKLTVAPPFDPNLFFASLKNLFATETEITPDPNYPFTMTTSSVNHYWGKRGDDGCLSEGIKILSRGIMARPVFKSDTEVIDQSKGIIKRKEIKGKRFSLLEAAFQDIVSRNESRVGKVEYAGFLFRSRKAIWLLNGATGRIYHVSLDKCATLGKMPLYQIEIEYSGKLKKANSAFSDSLGAEKEIVRETDFLAGRIMSFAESKGVRLSPGTEKFAWLAER